MDGVMATDTRPETATMMLLRMPSASPAVPTPPPRWRGVLAGLLSDAAPLDLRLVGRTLLHAVLVGLLAGVVAVLFVGALELHGVEVMAEDETHAAGARWTVPPSAAQRDSRRRTWGAVPRAPCVAHVSRSRIN